MVSIAIKLLIRLKPFRKQRPQIKYAPALISTHPKQPLVIKINPKLITSVDKVSSGYEFIFDASCVPFKSIIDQMQTSKSTPSSYKIQPKNCSYILGSNSADGIGEVIQF
jgi:hypothetical protein